MLLNTRTYDFKDFDKMEELGGPPYAILSHVWGTPEHEVTYADMQNPEVAQRRHGWPKVQQFCALAHQNGLEWACDDTCCIDKSSSAELSQAINSMYLWYAGARVCYAYLSDVEDSDTEDPRAEGSSFRRSRWFRRGWTLQELIAPRMVLFFSKSWHSLGSKFSLARVIEEITNVDCAVLMHRRLLDDVSIARRMSWASARETSKVEDRAYSLMGIFGVYMPTIYGEGDRAFIRLQMEIIRRSTDQSIFAWGTPYDFQVLLDNASAFSDGPRWAADFRSLLALSPDSFKGSANIVPFPTSHFSTCTHSGISCDIPEYTPTNCGIQIHLPLWVFPRRAAGLALLACKDSSTGDIVSLFVRRTNTNLLYVGAYTRDTRPTQNIDWHPRFRTFLIQPRIHPACSHILKAVRLSRLYLHSYNTNRLRSIARALASGDLMLGLPSDAGVYSKSRRTSFIIHDSLLQRLAQIELKVLGYGDLSPPFVGWAPRRLWHHAPGVGLKLTLEPLGECEDSESVRNDCTSCRAAVLFSRQHGDAQCEVGAAFALVFGVTAEGTLWITVAIVKPDRDCPGHVGESDGHVTHKLVRDLLAGFDVATDKTIKSAGYDVSRWVEGTYEQRTDDIPPRVVRVSLARWLAREARHSSNKGSVMTYTIGLEVDFRGE